MTHKDKNTYQRHYRQQKKHCTIIFTPEQHEFLNAKAKKIGKPFGTFLRERALASVSKEYILPFESQTNEVKILLIRYGTNLNQIAHLVNATKKISPEIIEDVRANFTKMQAGIMKIYNTPIEVKELVRRTVIKNPSYASEIIDVLNQSKQ